MKVNYLPVLPAFMLMLFYSLTYANPKVGFFLPDTIAEMTMKYRAIQNLIILPVTINNNVRVNLILDTGCRNLVLFGKRFKKLLKVNLEKQIVFSGLGDGDAVKGYLSTGNEVSIQSIHGHQIPIVVVPDQNLFETFPEVDGIIGYDIFLKLEIEINSKLRTLKFTPAQFASPRDGYSEIPLQIIDSKPILRTSITVNDHVIRDCDLIIDTGSTLGILLKTMNTGNFDARDLRVIGIGLNGPLKGFRTIAEKMDLSGLTISSLPMNIISSKWHEQASIGMEILKDYIVVLNYCKSYACLKRFDA
jgi:hypothetical protein